MFKKPLKTRIKKVTTAGGDVTHYAQFKYLFRWYRFSDTITVWSHTTPRTVWITSRYQDSSIDIKECQGLIDEYIEAFQIEADNRKKKKVVNVEYINYP